MGNVFRVNNLGIMFSGLAWWCARHWVWSSEPHFNTTASGSCQKWACFFGYTRDSDFIWI